MAHAQRLKLTLRNHVTDRTWTGQPLTITADPDDHAAILQHLEPMARNLDHRSGEADQWRKDYTVRVQGLEQEWRDFWLSGAGN